MNTCDDNTPIQIILGDTFINEKFPIEENVLLVSGKIKSSKQWCLVSNDENSNLKDIFNKQKDLSLEDKKALVGYYKFSDTKILKEIVSRNIKNNSESFEEVLKIYNKVHPLLIKQTYNWYDFGHIRGVAEARKDLFNARDFNSLKGDLVRGTITKISNKKQKLLDEANWMKNLPNDLLAFVPRVFDVRENEENAEIEMELYGYSSLSEIFVYGSNNLEFWMSIIDALFQMYKRFEEYNIEMDKENLIEIYEKKTKQRIDEIRKSAVSSLINLEEIKINDIFYKNLNLIADDLYEKIKLLFSYDRQTIVHGDFCFSNILFDPMYYIDPRGRFKEQSIYGDPRYDIAKLRHSVVGLYDFIIAGQYKLKQTDKNSFDFLISCPGFEEKLSEYFDKKVIENGFNLNEIKLIEALLFLTMIPLHSDDARKQKAFYLVAIKKINEVLYGSK